MIQSVEIENFLGEHVECVLTNPFGHGLNITNISGLGPEAINLVTQDLAIIDGSVYSTQRKSERNIVITYRFIEAPDIETVRHRTYDLFGLGRWVKLTFNTDHRSLWIEGFVESNEPDIFSDGETSQVSIICPDPWFRANIQNKATLLGVEDSEPCGFEFVTDYGFEMADRICFSERTRKTYSSEDEMPEYRYSVYNEGDRDVGFVLRFVCKQETHLSHAYVINNTTGQMMTLHCSNYRLYKPGDIYQINTIPAYKMISIYELGSDNTYKITPALNDIVRDFSWPTLRKGHNSIEIALMDSGHEGDYLAGTTVTDLFELAVIHTPLYEGV